MSKKKQPESVVSDRTPLREKLWTDLSVAITSATQLGLPRVVIVEDLLRTAENLCVICKEQGDDMTPLQGLLNG